MTSPFFEHPKKRTVTKKNPSQYPKSLRKSQVHGAFSKQIRDSLGRLNKLFKR